MTAVLADAPVRHRDDTRTAPVRQPRFSPVTRVVLGVDVAGVLGAALVALLLPVRPANWLLVAGLLVLTAAGELTYVRLRHGGSTEELTLFEAAVVIDVLLLSPALAIAVPVLALALASAVRRRPLVKAAFNLGTYGTATAVMVGTFHVVAGGADAFAARSVIGLCIGTAGFAAVNLVLLARILSVVEDVALRTVVDEGWRLSAFMAIGNVAVGTVAVSVASTNPTLLPFTALPAVALTYAYRQAARQSDERERSAELLALSQTLAGRLDTDDLVGSFLASARRAFRAEHALVILDTGSGTWPIVVEIGPDDTAVRRSATTGDVALLERAARGTAATVATDLLPEGWRRALLAPLEAEGLRLGVLALGTPTRSNLTTEDTALLAPLANALGIALRGAEHLDRLVEETTKLKAVVDHSSDGILVVDEEGRVLLWNPALTAITGVPGEEAAHRDLRELVTATDTGGENVDPLAATFALTPEQPRATVEMSVVRPDGEERWIRCAHAGIFDDGRLVRDVVIAHDVTRERQVERLKADFIATVSHELRTPITPIKGYTDLLRRRGEELSPDKRKEALDVISDRVAHLGRLVEDLLLASRVSSSSSAPTHAVSLGVDDLVRMTKRAAGDFSTDAARMNLLLPEAPVHVACDPVRTVQVLGNLISNALKYSPREAQVDVTLTVVNGSASLTVTDRGRGIPADQLERVFDKFHRVEDPMTMTTGGTGLGLFIARQLAHAMEGEIAVRSVLGSGSSFTFTLPLAETVPIPRLPAYDEAAAS